jgi:hypothetical protein
MLQIAAGCSNQIADWSNGKLEIVPEMRHLENFDLSDCVLLMMMISNLMMLSRKFETAWGTLVSSLENWALPIGLKMMKPNFFLMMMLLATKLMMVVVVLVWSSS